MLVLEFGFPAGRYHATPWGRNVNEGVEEWPPSPYRLARALVDTARRRRPAWPESRIRSLLTPLVNPVGFLLPPARASHVRCYMHSNQPDASKKQKIFDAFVALQPGEQLLAAFDGDPGPEVRRDLEDLLSELSYLGRSESWVRARVYEPEAPIGLNCVPANGSGDPEGMDRVPVACLRTEEAYEASSPKPGRTTGKGQKARKETFSWLDAICLSTADLLVEGWSSPPAQEQRDFLRAKTALAPPPTPRARMSQHEFHRARYALDPRVLPSVTDTVPFAERVRSYLMGIHRRIMNGDPSAVSMIFSGKDTNGEAAWGHEHVFYLPLDEDGDGRIDHLEIRSGRAFEPSELAALDRLRSVHHPKRPEGVDLVLVSLSAERASSRHTRWQSVTPVVLARHHRKGRGPFWAWAQEEIARECRCHGLPTPVTVQWVPGIVRKGRNLRWSQFVRSRKNQQPRQGIGCILTFAEPMPGPFALGALCHFGLGQFVPAAEG